MKFDINTACVLVALERWFMEKIGMAVNCTFFKMSFDHVA